MRNTWSILRENALQILMYILGTILIGLIWWPLGLIYLGYSLFSNVLYMAWICPYCGHCSLGREFGMEFFDGQTAGPGWRARPEAWCASDRSIY